MAEQTWPEEFRDLEIWAPWALETERERSDKRQASSMEEIQALYNALLPRMEELLSYLDKAPLDEMPAESRPLLLLTLALAEVAPAVELFGQPSVRDGFDIRRVVPRRRG